MDASVNRIPSSEDERSLLLAIKLKSDDSDSVKYSLDELKMLVKTAGGITVDSRIVNREKYDASYIIGKGFLEELKNIIIENGIKLIVFDLNNIRPAQVRNLEEALKIRVIGRTEIILDIFARRARSNEAMIQVELAQLNYILPRLKGLGGVLSRLGGGIGTRGPGEKMLETDRRHILKRINTLQNKLKKIQKHRSLTRQTRKKTFHGAVAGYTNAGKSTLINCLAKDDLFVENRLFATLDSYTRTVFLNRSLNTLLTDTVGFIRNLPANLIESFRSTLEEISFADYILHVVDISAEEIEENIKTVEKELIQLEAIEKPIILFFNKCDLVNESKINSILTRYPNAVIGSAIENTGLTELKNTMINVYIENFESIYDYSRKYN